MDELKRAIRNMAFNPFFNGDVLGAAPDGYEVTHVETLSIMVRVPGTKNAAGISSGPRYFEIRVREKL